MTPEAFVYCWSDNATAKVYVGVHKGTPDDGYICSSKRMMPEYKSRSQDFSRQIIAQGTLNDCAVLEVAIIKKLLLDKETCYNRAAGKMIINDIHPMLGKNNREGREKGVETIKKKRLECIEYDLYMKSVLSKGRMGKESPRKGVKLSDEIKQKISKNSYWKGKVGINAGKTFSEEHNKKLSESHKGKVLSAETRKKISDAAKRQWELARVDRLAKEDSNGC